MNRPESIAVVLNNIGRDSCCHCRPTGHTKRSGDTRHAVSFKLNHFVGYFINIFFRNTCQSRCARNGIINNLWRIVFEEFFPQKVFSVDMNSGCSQCENNDILNIDGTIVVYIQDFICFVYSNIFGLFQRIFYRIKRIKYFAWHWVSSYNHVSYKPCRFCEIKCCLPLSAHIISNKIGKSTIIPKLTTRDIYISVTKSSPSASFFD